MSYDAHSPDAMFSRIIARLDEQDTVLKRIDAGVAKTNGRVDQHDLEIASVKQSMAIDSARNKWIVSGISAGIGMIGFIVTLYFTHT